MSIYLIRHGETLEGKEGRILGWKGGKLSSYGIKYSEDTACFFINKNININSIISSDLDRAIETAEIMANYLQKSYSVDELIRERNAGEAEGKLEKEIDWITYEKCPITERKHKGGESFLDVQKRANIFLNKAKCFKEIFLVVSHSVFILMIISIINHLSIEEALRTDINKRIIKLDFVNNEWLASLINME